MNDEIIYLYDEYTHSPMPRRTFLRRLTRLAGGTAAAVALLPLLEGTGARAAQIAPDDARLAAGYVTYKGATGPVRAYRARPTGSAKLPAILVIHQNKGLTAHIEDVARRAALEGYIALAPDALSPAGGAPKDPDKAKALIRGLDKAATLKNFLAAVSYLKDDQQSTGKIGCVGFCWGGAMSNQLAVHSRDLAAAVIFYGRSPRSEDVPKIQVPMLLNYAGLDKRIGAGVPDYERALIKAGKIYTVHTYGGVHHAFHDDTRDARYDKRAAQLAWRRTMVFFEKHLKG